MRNAVERRRAARGFTLVELMIVVGIIGILASVAVPQFERYTLRSKSAERLTIMSALADAVTDTVNVAQRVPTGVWGPGFMFGRFNPVGMPGKTKRKLDWTIDDWKSLPMVVQGDTHYQYQFMVQDPGGGMAPQMWVWCNGDLDGDGMTSQKQMFYQAVGFQFQLQWEWPERGREDLATFNTF